MTKLEQISVDRGKATTLLDESLAISSELGMRPLRERVLSRRGILKAQNSGLVQACPRKS